MTILETTKGLAVRPAGYRFGRASHAIGAVLVVIVAIGMAPGCSTASNSLDGEDSGTRSAIATPSIPSMQRSPECSQASEQGANHAFAELPEVTFFSRSSKLSVRGRLYSQRAAIDETMAQQLDSLFADARDPNQTKQTTIDRRLLQLLFLTAYHFKVGRIEVVSGYREQRRKREGLHALGRAIDFVIPDVKLEILASYLRSKARVGVGIYTHRRTRFVHLDVREHSYHWLDASPPGRTWRGISIGNRSLPKRDAAYQPCDDWPEALCPPAPLRPTTESTSSTNERNDVPSVGGIGNEAPPYPFEHDVAQCLVPRGFSDEVPTRPSGTQSCSSAAAN